jgi:acyl-CoA thioesterase I
MRTGGFHSQRGTGALRLAILGGIALLGGLLAACSAGRPMPTTFGGLPSTDPATTRQPTVAAPTGEPVVTSGASLRYVALGDSYTIGTSVTAPERWPDQLVALVPRLELVANLAVNGFTSGDVIEIELPRLDDLRPEFITLLIGVNDVVQRVSPETYRDNVGKILDDAVGRVGAGRVLVVTTPDYTVTPAGADYGDPATQAAGIRANNAIISEVAGELAVRVVDIHDISLGAGTDRGLVASDGLHPSGAQYARWVERIGPAVRDLLDE